jgi:hypothetical protein
MSRFRHRALDFSLLLPLFFLISLPLCSSEAHASMFSIGDEFIDIGLNFTGSSISTSGFIPPDTMGAVGPSSIVELINGRYAVYDKSAGALVQTSTLDQFWKNAGADPKGFSFDPRIVYDPFSERYFAASADNARAPNNILLAVSNTSDPTMGWTGFSVKSDPTQLRWSDYPTLGFNRDGVYVSANMFPISDAGQSRETLVVPKADLLAAVPTVANATLFTNTLTGFTTQPAVDLDNKSGSATLISSPTSLADRLVRSDIVGNIRAPTLVSPSAVIPVSAFSSINSAVQPPPGLSLDIANGTQLHANVVIQNNALWGVQTVRVSGQAALRWFQIDLGTNKVLQEGLIKQSGLNFFYGSIAVNKAGDVVIGFTGSGASQFASAYAVAGVTRGGVTAFGDPMLLQEGVASYQRLDSSSGLNRWGDYSATVLDPSDAKSFWTIQEWASGSGSWSTQIAQITFGVVSAPEPPTWLIVGSAFFWLVCRRRSTLPPSRDMLPSLWVPRL